MNDVFTRSISEVETALYSELEKVFSIKGVFDIQNS
jgi:hypothetical protein